MSIVADYPSFSSARENLKEVLDATEHGVSVSVARQGNVSVVLPLDRLRDYFFRTVSALTDLALVVREYAADWDIRLKDAPNHQQYWALGQLVKYSTDEQLREWFETGGE